MTLVLNPISRVLTAGAQVLKATWKEDSLRIIILVVTRLCQALKFLRVPIAIEVNVARHTAKIERESVRICDFIS